MPTTTKARVTLTLNSDLVAAVDQYACSAGARSRSAAVEEILLRWRQEEAVRQYEREVETYYRTLPEEEEAENEEWALFASETAAVAWDHRKGNE